MNLKKRAAALRGFVKASHRAPAASVVAEMYDRLEDEAKRRVFYYLHEQIANGGERKIEMFPPPEMQESLFGGVHEEERRDILSPLPQRG